MLAMKQSHNSHSHCSFTVVMCVQSLQLFNTTVSSSHVYGKGADLQDCV